MEEWLKHKYSKQGGNLADLFGDNGPNELDLTPLPTSPGTDGDKGDGTDGDGGDGTDGDGNDGDGQPEEEYFVEQLIEPVTDIYVPSEPEAEEIDPVDVDLKAEPEDLGVGSFDQSGSNNGSGRGNNLSFGDNSIS
jgi:hypothetical protein